MFLYARIQKEKLEHPKINSGIVKLFIERGAQLDCVISPARFTILTLAIAYQCIDIVKLVVEKRLDTLFAGDGEVFPIFVEYHLFKTHNLLKWLLEEHLSNDIPGFIHRLLDEDVFLSSNRLIIIILLMVSCYVDTRWIGRRMWVWHLKWLRKLFAV